MASQEAIVRPPVNAPRRKRSSDGLNILVITHDRKIRDAVSQGGQAGCRHLIGIGQRRGNCSSPACSDLWLSLSLLFCYTFLESECRNHDVEADGYSSGILNSEEKLEAGPLNTKSILLLHDRSKPFHGSVSVTTYVNS